MLIIKLQVRMYIYIYFFFLISVTLTEIKKYIYLSWCTWNVLKIF